MSKPTQPLTPGPPPRTPPPLDGIDRALIDALRADGRASNVALAAQAGIAESTCIGRVRSLRERGIVRGFTARVDMSAVGLPIEAMVAVRLAGTDRARVDAFGEHVSRLPGVLAAYNVSGAEDFLVHLVAESPDTLRGIVLDHLSGHPGVVHVHTSLIFRTHEGRQALPMP
ncbi:MAG: Lrp/AsnC family transcriptional regulator [Candidatus Phosphoribacter sp.]|nr:Lrp/AsnC family transcriptional regulator [Actinomycetales bacterium]